MPSNATLDEKYALTKEDIDKLAQHKLFREKKLKEAELKKGSWDSESI